MVDLSPTSLIVAHYSMKFSYQASHPWMGGLTKLQSQHDVDTFYARAVHKGYAWATGTEAGQNPLQRQLRKGAKANGYRFYVRKGNWIVVRKDRIKRFSWSKGHCFVAHKDETLGPGQDSEFGWVSYFDRELNNQVSIAAGHKPTKGSRPSDPNFRIQERYNKVLDDWALSMAKGRALVFCGMDQNMQDQKFDTFQGGNFISNWDELQKYPSTGHGGPIDVTGRLRIDERVSCVYARSFNDKKMFMYGDHFPTEVTYEVGP